MATQDDSTGDPEEAVTDTPTPTPRIKTPRGVKGATKAISELGFMESIIRELTTDRDKKLQPLNEEIARINAEYEETIAPILIEFVPRMYALHRWYRRNLRRYGVGRSINLASGSIGQQLDGQWTVDVVGDKDEVLKAVRKRGMKFIKVTMTIKKREIGNDRRRFRKVEGLHIHRRDRFFVKPTILRDSNDPGEDRLRIAVEDLTE
jgi:phage host-nuclease inhibitor protein Gam